MIPIVRRKALSFQCGTTTLIKNNEDALGIGLQRRYVYIVATYLQVTRPRAPVIFALAREHVSQNELVLRRDTSLPVTGIYIMQSE